MLTMIGIILHSLFKRKIVRYGNKVVKSGIDLRPSEFDATRFVGANTSIPIPRVYEEGSEPGRSITMDYVEGYPLDKVWNQLSKEQKLDIASQLRAILTELRELKGSYVGSLNRGKAVDGRRSDFEGGPFDTEVEFNNFLLSDTIPSCPNILRDIARRSLRTDHEIVFTHGDFHPRNILVKDGRVVGLLDWEYSGWYPEYWEFVKTFVSADHTIDWYDYVKLIFPKCYEAEFINDRFLGTILRH
jgi:aminoglycoside phosphotransferase (APT) family kinase protein